MTDIIDDLTWRGLIAVSTDLDDLRKALGAGQVTFYCGFDPTAASLHIGSMVQLLTMRRLQLAGHRPIGLVGGATGLIGDPSGKSAERVLNSPDLVAGWVEKIRGQVRRFLNFEPGPAAASVVSNLDWTQQLTALEFLRDIGKHFPINQMLSRETVRARLEAGGISYTEFSYQILQGNDYLELHRRNGCTLQVGGSDQWGNLISGVDLIRRVTGSSVHALATPLITKPDGTKYGKTESGAVWLSPELTSPYAFYQFWLNRTDAEVPALLRVFTFRSKSEIEELERATAERPSAREAQRVLADDVTTLVHGPAETARAAAAGRALFGQGDLRDLDERTLAAALAEVPMVSIDASGTTGPAEAVRWSGSSKAGGPSGSNEQSRASREGRASGESRFSGAGRPSGTDGTSGAGGVGEPDHPVGLRSIADLMAACGIAPSKSAARRAIAAGGAYLNNAKVQAVDAAPQPDDLLFGQYLVLRRGKRTVGGVRVLGAMSRD